MLLDKVFNYYASRKWGKVGVRRGENCSFLQVDTLAY